MSSSTEAGKLFSQQDPIRVDTHQILKDMWNGTTRKFKIIADHLLVKNTNEMRLYNSSKVRYKQYYCISKNIH